MVKSSRNVSAYSYTVIFHIITVVDPYVSNVRTDWTDATIHVSIQVMMFFHVSFIA